MAETTKTEEQKPMTEELKEENRKEGIRDIKFLLDIPLQITVELGRTKMSLQEVLQLGQGSVVELDKLAGEPLEILVNERPVARGEVVVVNEKFGVRITEILSPEERVKRLK